MGWFDAALADEHAALDRALVRVLGLFDRPAPWGAVQGAKETGAAHPWIDRAAACGR